MKRALDTGRMEADIALMILLSDSNRRKRRTTRTTRMRRNILILGIPSTPARRAMSETMEMITTIVSNRLESWLQKDRPGRGVGWRHGVVRLHNQAFLLQAYRKGFRSLRTFPKHVDHELEREQRSECKLREVEQWCQSTVFGWQQLCFSYVNSKSERDEDCKGVLGSPVFVNVEASCSEVGEPMTQLFVHELILISNPCRLRQVCQMLSPALQ